MKVVKRLYWCKKDCWTFQLVFCLQWVFSNWD